MLQTAEYGFMNIAISLIESFFKRKQMVGIEENKSDFIDANLGVPLESVLETVIFLSI